MWIFSGIAHWGPMTRNLTEIGLRGFLYQGTIVRQNQPEVSKKVVSISRVLIVLPGDFRSWESPQTLPALFIGFF